MGERFEKILNFLFLTYVFMSLIAYILVSKLKSRETNITSIWAQYEGREQTKIPQHLVFDIADC